ncbi:hypothetical protein TCA2_1917 [Paenibacillus sp. TCA20]|nr:hypothetical protein TCA2_1917 [Paenibacillus sp. TCA20]
MRAAFFSSIDDYTYSGYIKRDKSVTAANSMYCILAFVSRLNGGERAAEIKWQQNIKNPTRIQNKTYLKKAMEVLPANIRLGRNVKM